MLAAQLFVEAGITYRSELACSTLSGGGQLLYALSQRSGKRVEPNHMEVTLGAYELVAKLGSSPTQAAQLRVVSSIAPGLRFADVSTAYTG